MDGERKGSYGERIFDAGDFSSTLPKMIDPPKKQERYPGRLQDCEAALEPLFLDLVQTAVAQGWGPAETRKALYKLIIADRRKDFENAKIETELALIRAKERATRF